MSDQDDQWWFCLRHRSVEQGPGCANSERMGPYETSQQAEASLRFAAERTEQWEHDPKWNDEDDA